MASDGRFARRNILQRLPEILDYTGEFGTELALFLPFCEWLSAQGLLRDRSLRTYAGMECFYEHLAYRSLLKKFEERRYIAADRRPLWLPVNDEHEFDTWTSKRFFRYPDLRSHFSRYRAPEEVTQSGKPLLIIHNKYNVEWDRGPINYIPLDVLDRLLERLKAAYTVVYIRHGPDSFPGYSQDHNTPLPSGDAEVLARHPTVLGFDDLYKRSLPRGQARDINTFKNALYSRCHFFISSQGGGACHAAFYSGSLIAILHKEGSESRWAYSSGCYGLAADPPAIRAICGDENELENVMPLFFNSRLVGGKVRIGDAGEALIRKLRPKVRIYGYGGAKSEDSAARRGLRRLMAICRWRWRWTGRTN
jgi:hypothetical protein